MLGMLPEPGALEFAGPAPGVGGAVFAPVGSIGPGGGRLGPGPGSPKPGTDGPGCPGALAAFRGDEFSVLPSAWPSFLMLGDGGGIIPFC
jgi:hypothetical protein